MRHGSKTWGEQLNPRLFNSHFLFNSLLQIVTHLGTFISWGCPAASSSVSKRVSRISFRSGPRDLTATPTPGALMFVWSETGKVIQKTMYRSYNIIEPIQNLHIKAHDIFNKAKMLWNPIQFAIVGASSLPFEMACYLSIVWWFYRSTSTVFSTQFPESQCCARASHRPVFRTTRRTSSLVRPGSGTLQNNRNITTWILELTLCGIVNTIFGTCSETSGKLSNAYLLHMVVS